MSVNRQPDTDVQTYRLGHYEQAVFAKAIAYLAYGDEAHSPDEAETACLMGLGHVFAGHGTVTIVRTNDRE